MTEGDGNDGLAFATWEWPFDTACFAGTTGWPFRAPKLGFDAAWKAGIQGWRGQVGPRGAVPGDAFG